MRWSIYETRFGAGAVVESERGLYAILLPAYSREEIDEVVERRFPVMRKVGSLVDARKLEAYFDGEPQSWLPEDIDLDGYGEFEKLVYAEAMRVPYASTSTYSNLAREAGNPDGARAAGNAMAKNRLPIVVP